MVGEEMAEMKEVRGVGACVSACMYDPRSWVLFLMVHA
jgi:chemotaxis receptor (MCP) glutamine deamidase CheD